MPKAKYQFEEFLETVPLLNRDFVCRVRELLLHKNYKGRLSVTKSTGFQLAFHEPKIKSTVGILAIFFKRQDPLILRIYGRNHQCYQDVLEELPSWMVSHIKEAMDCKKFKDPEACWKGCRGLDFSVRGEIFQKCLVDCFEFKVDEASEPHLLRIIEGEKIARLGAGV